MKKIEEADSPSLAELVVFLKENTIFSTLSDEHLLEVAEASNFGDYPAGTALFSQDDPGDCAYLIVRGSVSIENDTETGRVTIATVGAGNLIGEIGAFASTLRTASVVMATKAQLLRIDQDTIHGLLTRAPKSAMKVIAELGTRLQQNNHSVAIMSQAANALAAGEFEPNMLHSLKQEADRFGQFANVFEKMANEITSKRDHGREMHTAEEIQRSFLPSGIDAGSWHKCFDVAAEMIPAKQVGGDFFDYFMIDDRNVGFAVGDVSGKGVPAAIFMSVSRTVLKTIARQGGSAADVISSVNDLLAEDNAEGMFVTLVYGCLNLETGALDYTSAAHEEAYFLFAEGSIEQIPPMGAAVGIFEDMKFTSRHRILNPGDTIFLGTDGITEAFREDGGMYGIERFEASLKQAETADVHNLVSGIMNSVASFADGFPQSDDLTCMALRYNGPADREGG